LFNKDKEVVDKFPVKSYEEIKEFQDILEKEKVV